MSHRRTTSNPHLLASKDSELHETTSSRNSLIDSLDNVIETLVRSKTVLQRKQYQDGPRNNHSSDSSVMVNTNEVMASREFISDGIGKKYHVQLRKRCQSSLIEKRAPEQIHRERHTFERPFENLDNAIRAFGLSDQISQETNQQKLSSSKEHRAPTAYPIRAPLPDTSKLDRPQLKICDFLNPKDSPATRHRKLISGIGNFGGPDTGISSYERDQTGKSMRQKKSHMHKVDDPICFCHGAVDVDTNVALPNWEHEFDQSRAREKFLKRGYKKEAVAEAWNKFYGEEKFNGENRSNPLPHSSKQAERVSCRMADSRRLKTGQAESDFSKKAFYGTVEVEANVANTIKLLVKAHDSMRNLNFAAGVILPATRKYSEAISEMQKHLTQFSTHFRSLRARTNEAITGNSGPDGQLTFEKPPHKVVQRFPGLYGPQK